MLHYLWAGMILLGIVYGCISGTAAALGNQALESAKEAVSLGISMAGAMALWSGLMEVASASGLLEQMLHLLRKPLRFLFPEVPAGHPAEEAIATNLVANILGLGWAATPAGLRAMRELRRLQDEQEKPDTEQRKPAHVQGSSTAEQGASAAEPARASTAMCTFLIINVSSLQLIPVNIIAYRSQYGSVSPAAIIGFSLVTTACSTLVAVIYATVRRRHEERRHEERCQEERWGR